MNGVTQREWSFLLLLWGLSDPRIAELREMPQSFIIKLYSETQVSGRLGMSGGISPRHAQNPLSGYNITPAACYLSLMRTYCCLPSRCRIPDTIDWKIPGSCDWKKNSRKTRDVLVWCWTNVADGVLILIQQSIDTSCFLDNIITCGTKITWKLLCANIFVGRNQFIDEQ